MYRRSLAILFVIAALLLWVTNAAAKRETIFDVGVRYVGSSENDDSAIDTEIQRTVLWASGTLERPMGEHGRLLVGAAYRVQFIDYDEFRPFVVDGNTARHKDLPDALHALDLSLGFIRTWSERWSVLVEFRPGIHSDLENISGDDIVYTGMFLAERAFEGGHRLGLGASYTDVLGDEVFLPLLRVYWHPTPQWFVEGTLPMSLDIGVRIGGSVRAGIEGYLQGHQYRLSEDDPWDNGVIRHREVHVGPFVDFATGPGGHLRLGAGLATAQKFEFRDEDNDETLRDGDFEDTWYIAANLFVVL